MPQTYRELHAENKTPATLQYIHVACGTCSMLQQSSVSAPSSSAECVCSAAQYLSQLVASSLLPVCPCNTSLAYQAALLLCHQNSKWTILIGIEQVIFSLDRPIVQGYPNGNRLPA